MRNAILNRSKEIAQLKNARNVHKMKIETLDKRIVELEQLRIKEQKEIDNMNIKNSIDAFAALLNTATKIIEIWRKDNENNRSKNI